jgi:thymidylate synthase
VTAWRPDELDEMALPPCHYAWQILSDGYYLDLIWIQRSVDVGLGLPYNIASYGLLLELLGKELNLTPRRLIGQLGDTHIYENHEEKLAEQMGRVPFDLPTVNILNFTNIFDWTYKDIELLNYQHHPKIELEIAV